MSQEFVEGHLTFSFPDGWLVCRPESCNYYGHFSRLYDGCKEMDFLAYDPATRTLWLIEVKDYRIHPRTKQQPLVDEIAHKTRDVLALLPAAKVRDDTLSEVGNLQVGDFARKSADMKELRVVLHCELPAKPSKLYPLIKEAANLTTALRRRLRPVDPHAITTNGQHQHNFGWTVS